MSSQHLINNERGDVSLLGIFLLLVVLTASGLITKKMIIYHEDMKRRLETYTCFKKSIDLIRDTQSEMSIYNKALFVAHLVKNAEPNPYILLAIQGLKIMQIKVLITYRLNVARLPKCSLWNKSKIIHHFPYKTAGYLGLTRAPMDQTILKIKVKPLIIKAKKDLMTIFTLEAKYRLRPSFQLIKTKEKSSLLNQIGVL